MAKINKLKKLNLDVLLKVILHTFIFISVVNCSGKKDSDAVTDIEDTTAVVGGSGASTTYAVAQDNVGNMYSGGFYTNNNLDADKMTDVNGDTLLGLSSVSTQDGFVVKIDNKGVQKWIRRIGGSGVDQISAITTNGADVYVSGRFEDNSARTNGSVDFNGSPLSGKSSGTTSRDIFVAKLDTNGSQVWIKTLGGSGDNDFNYSLSIANNGDLYITGIYQNSTANITGAKDFSDNTLLGMSTSSTQDAFVAKLSSSDGSQIWIKTLGGSGTDRAYRLAVNTDDSIIVPGYFVNSSANNRSTVDFSGQTLTGLTSSSVEYGYVAKLGSDGTQQWIKKFGGTSVNDFLDQAAVDNSGNIYVSGSYGNDMTDTNTCIDFSGNQLLGKTSTSSREILVAKLSSTGSQLWIKTMGGSGSDRSQALGLDKDNNIFISGYFTNNSANDNSGVDFKGDTILGKSTGATGVDGLLTKFDSSGNQLWIAVMGGNGNDVIEGMSVDSFGNAAVVGYMNNNLSNTNNVTDFSGDAIYGRSSGIISTSFTIRYSGPSLE